MDHVAKLVLFSDVVERGSFSAAAAHWGLSHSTVSKHIKTLEVHLGVQLLRRTSRTMTLTEAGELVLGYGRRVGSSMHELGEQLATLRGEVSGTLRVHGLVHVGRHLVQPAVAALLAEHPHLQVRAVFDDGPLAFHRDGIDVAVRVGLDASADLAASKLMDNEVCLVAAPSLLERHGTPSHPRDLARFPTVAYESGSVRIDAWSYREGDEVHTVAITPACTFSDGNALADGVAAGLGVGYLSAFAAHRGLERGELLRVLPQFELPAYDPVYLLYARTEYVSPSIRAFLRHIRAVARSFGGASGRTTRRKPRARKTKSRRSK